MSCNTRFVSNFEEPFDGLRVNGQAGVVRGSQTMNGERYTAITARLIAWRFTFDARPGLGINQGRAPKGLSLWRRNGRK